MIVDLTWIHTSVDTGEQPASYSFNHSVSQSVSSEPVTSRLAVLTLATLLLGKDEFIGGDKKC